jgi:hypothetical protein
VKSLLSFTVDIEGSMEKYFDGDATMVPKIVSLFTDKASSFTSLQFFHTTLPYVQGTLWDRDYVPDTAGDDYSKSEDDGEPNPVFRSVASLRCPWPCMTMRASTSLG